MVYFYCIAGLTVRKPFRDDLFRPKWFDKGGGSWSAYEARLKEMLAQAEVSPELIDGLLDRLEAFVEPFAASLDEPEQRRHAAEYMTGLLSKLERKTGEAIAYLHDQERQGLQKFVGQVPWDHRPLLDDPGPPGRRATWASPTA